jgi:hypothetical protein
MKRRFEMKLQRTFICIVGVFFAVGFIASQAGAGNLPGGDFCGSFNEEGEWVPMTLEINQMRAGGRTVVTGPNDTTKVTAKARILKGTAVSGTTIATTLTIETIVDGGIVSDADQKNITLGVGKGGKGASLLLDTTVCSGAGFLVFRATFEGLDKARNICTIFRDLRKECR